MKYMTATQIKKDLDREFKKRDKKFNELRDKASREIFQLIIDRALKYMVIHDVVKIGPKNKKLLKSSKVRAYFKAVNEKMNSPKIKEEIYGKLADMDTFGFYVSDGNGKRVSPDQFFSGDHSRARGV